SLSITNDDPKIYDRMPGHDGHVQHVCVPPLPRTGYCDPAGCAYDPQLSDPYPGPCVRRRLWPRGSRDPREPFSGEPDAYSPAGPGWLSGLHYRGVACSVDVR